MNGSRSLTLAQKQADDFRPVIDEPLDVIDGVDLKPARPREGGAPAPLARFSGAVLMDCTAFAFDSGDHMWIGEGVYDLWPIHSRAATTAGQSGERLIISALDSAGPKQVKGRVRGLMPRMLRLSRAFIGADRVGRTTVEYFGVAPGERLVNITNIGGGALPLTADREQLIRLLAGLPIRMDYTWTVEIGRAQSAFRVKIPTTAPGARDLLSLRDVPEGRERRAALRHWVDAHQRRRPRSDESDVADVAVREHLRGATSFDWGDLAGVVRPAPFDVRRAEAARA